METLMNLKKGASLAELNHLLKTNQYDEIDALFHEAQNTEHNELWLEILTIAHEICCVCRTMHEEATWYRAAAEDTERREDELKRSLMAITQLAAQSEFILSQTNVITPTCQRRKNLPIWQRLANLLKLTSENGAYADVPFETDVDYDDEDETQPAPPEEMGAGLHIYGLGRFRVRLNRQLVEIGANRKAKSILKYLILHHTQPVSKEVLMACFWPDADPEDARNNLNVAVYNLRQALRKVDASVSHILFQEDAYLLNPAVDVWIDFERFVQHCEAAKQFEAEGDVAEAIHEYKKAEQLYGGQLFEEDRYEDWPVAHRRFLHETYQRVLEFLTRQAFAAENYAECIGLSNKMLIADPCREDAHGYIMQSHSRQGKQHLALRQYKIAVESLKKELDVLPSAEFEHLYHKIRANAAV